MVGVGVGCWVLRRMWEWEIVGGFGGCGGRECVCLGSSRHELQIRLKSYGKNMVGKTFDVLFSLSNHL